MLSSRGGRREKKRRPGTSRYMPLASSRSSGVLLSARSGAVAGALRSARREALSSSRRGRVSKLPLASPIRKVASTPKLSSGRRTLQSTVGGPAAAAATARKPVDLQLVRNLLQRLVEQRPPKDSDQFRHVFQLFGRPKMGVTWEIFQRQIHTRLGMRLTDAEAQELFAQFDTEGKGALSLPEVIAKLMPPDYTRPTWNIERDKEMTREENQRRSKFLPYQAEVPASLKSQEWSLQDFIRTLQTKIIERTKRPSDQFREAYIVFGKPEKGLTRREFQEMVLRLGIVVTDAQMDIVMKHFDTDRNGVLSFEELCRKVIQPDYTAKQWTEERDDELVAAMETKAHGAAETTLKKWPETLKAVKPTIKQLQQQLAEKILERTKRANDQYREAFQLFGSPAHGIKFKDFKHQLRALGIVASGKALKALFKVLDINKNGYLSFQELVQQVLPKDYHGETWVERSDRAAMVRQQQREARFNPVLDKWPSSLKHAQMSEDEIVRLIQRKIVERTKRPEDQYREAFKVFGSPQNGISEKELGVILSKLGMVISDEQLHHLFAKWDENANGLLEFSEFVAKVMEPDYTGKSWYIESDERALAKMEAERQAFLAESPFAPRRRAANTAKLGGPAEPAAADVVPGTGASAGAGAGAGAVLKASAGAGAVLKASAGAGAVLKATHRSDDSAFKEDDLEELLTPVPPQVIEAGMRELKARYRREQADAKAKAENGRRRRRRHRRNRKRTPTGGAGVGRTSTTEGPRRDTHTDVSMPLSTARIKPLQLPRKM